MIITYHTIRSSTTQGCVIPIIKESWWSNAEQRYLSIEEGKNVLVYVVVRNQVMTKYIISRTDTGYVRNTICSRIGERDIIPINIVDEHTVIDKNE